MNFNNIYVIILFLFKFLFQVSEIKVNKSKERVKTDTRIIFQKCHFYLKHKNRNCIVFVKDKDVSDLLILNLL